MSDLEDFRRTMLASQATAEEAIVHGDPGPRMELWSRQDPVTLFGAASGMAKSGWGELSRIFEWVGADFTDARDFRFDVEAVEVSGNLAYTAGFERLYASWAGSPVRPFEVRVTHVYRRENREWKIVHRHGDSGVVDQSPPAGASSDSAACAPASNGKLDQIDGSTNSTAAEKEGQAAAGSLEDFRRTILASQPAAEEAMVQGDPEPRMKLWSRRDPVTVSGAWGMSTSGWDELSRIFRWVASRFSHAGNLYFDIEVADVSGDLGYTVGYERFKASIEGDPVAPMTVRVTHAYRREDGVWKIVHRHEDVPPVDESPRPRRRHGKGREGAKMMEGGR